MFTTEAVADGRLVYFAARLLGPRNIAATETHMAVFQEDLIRSYRSFLDLRRAARPPEEDREPTAEESREFQQHFQLRKLELGECSRPYGTPCRHEHSCFSEPRQVPAPCSELTLSVLLRTRLRTRRGVGRGP